jgi:hypothetical protein
MLLHDVPIHITCYHGDGDGAAATAAAGAPGSRRRAAAPARAATGPHGTVTARSRSPIQAATV